MKRFCWLVAKLFLTFVTPWSITRQASLSLGLFRQENWSWLSFPPQGHLPDSRIEPVSPASSALTGRFFTSEPLGKFSIRSYS